MNYEVDINVETKCYLMFNVEIIEFENINI